MFDATRLLGSMLGTRTAPSAGQRIERAAQSGPGGLDLGAMLGGLLGKAGAGGQGAGVGGGVGGVDLGGLLGRAGDMARQATQDPVREVKGNNPVAVGGLGALAGGLLGRSGGGALAGGVLAVLGSLAYQALQGAQAGPAAAVATLPQDEEGLQHEARLLLRAMIQAAQADGEVDGAEIGRILDRLRQHGEEEEARAFVEAELRKAPDVEALAREVRSPEQAARVYAASLLAIEVDTPAERAHLAHLASAMRLSSDAVARLHQGLGLPG